MTGYEGDVSVMRPLVNYGRDSFFICEHESKYNAL